MKPPESTQDNLNKGTEWCTGSTENIILTHTHSLEHFYHQLVCVCSVTRGNVSIDEAMIKRLHLFLKPSSLTA